MNTNSAPDPTRPSIHPEKKTTQVNLGVIVGVLCFFALGFLATCMTIRNPPQNETEVVPGGAPASAP